MADMKRSGNPEDMLLKPFTLSRPWPGAWSVRGTNGGRTKPGLCKTNRSRREYFFQHKEALSICRTLSSPTTGDKCFLSARAVAFTRQRVLIPSHQGPEHTVEKAQAALPPGWARPKPPGGRPMLMAAPVRLGWETGAFANGATGTPHLMPGGSGRCSARRFLRSDCS